jgi:general secretion pathway protein G
MLKLSNRQKTAWRQRGDLVTRRRRVLLSARVKSSGFSLIELVITVTVLTILTMGVIPLVRVAVRRQKEQQLHDALRQMRTAIDEFHRDTIGMNCSGTAGIGQQPQPGAQPGGAANFFVDPRSKVVISDCTIFGVDNPDHYPPTLEMLMEGVNVLPRAGSGQGGRGLQSTGTSSSNTNSVLDSQASTKKKVYLREIPIDPMTGKADWDFKSCYDAVDTTSWGGENVFDVRSKSKEKALNGEQYSDW